MISYQPRSLKVTWREANSQRGFLKLRPLAEKFSMKTITIIGGGATGTLLAVNLVQQAANHLLQINVIERREKLGRGIAYSTKEDFHLLNVPASKMSAFPDEPDHFCRWLEKKGFSFGPQDFVPRYIYGYYLCELFRLATMARQPKITLSAFDDEAVDICPSERNRIEVSLSSGKKLPSDVVVLAFGNSPPSHPECESMEFASSEKYFRDPWDGALIERIAPGDRVFIIGTGLTMIDVVLSLYHSRHHGAIYALSARGLLPAPHLPSPAYESFYREMAGLRKVSDMLRMVRQHIELAEAKGINWRGVIDSLRPHTQQLWINLPMEERRRFMRHLSRYWNVARHRVPLACAGVIAELENRRRLEILKGRLRDIRIRPGGGFSISYLPLGQRRVDAIEADAIINCGGPRCDFTLLDALLSRGLIRRDPLGLGLDALPDGRTIDAGGNISDRVYAIGVALKGILWETTAIPEIRAQAHQLARQLLSD